MNRRLGTEIAVNLIVLVITLLGGALTLPLLSHQEQKWVFGGGILIASMSILLTYGWLILDSIRRNRAAMSDISIAARALPRMVRFTNRSDRVTLHQDGSAVFEWDWEIAVGVDDIINELSFPVIVDLDPEKSELGKRVILESLVVDGQSRDVSGVYQVQQVRSACNPDVGPSAMEYGLLTVPVQLGRGKSSCRLQITMRFRNVFGKMKIKDYVIVDIPYITENLTLTITSDEGREVRGVMGDHDVVEGWSLVMDNFDIAETREQKGNWQAHGTRLIWRTIYPKLGYRYRVWFRVTGAGEVESVA